MFRTHAASRRAVLLGAFSLLALLPTRAHAAWPNDPAQPLPIATVAGIQFPYDAIADGAGGVFVLWMDRRAGNFDIYAQHLDAAGNALWAANGLAVQTGVTDQAYPLGVLDGAGGLIVGWLELGSPVAVRAQRLNGAGAPQWGAGGVIVAAQANNQNLFHISTDGAGGALFSWDYTFGASDHDVYAQRLNAAGVRQWGAAGAPVSTTTDEQEANVSVSDGAGGLWVAWRDDRTVTHDIYAQHLNSAGTGLLTYQGVNVETFVPAALEEPVAVSDGAGGMILGFGLDSGGFEAEMIHVFADGNFQTIVMTVETGDQRRVTLAPDPTGGAFAFWSDTRSDIRSDVYGTYIRAAGNRGPAWTQDGDSVATGDEVYQDAPKAIADGEGGAIVVWQEGGPTIKQLMAKRFDTNHTLPAGWGPFGNAIATKPVPNGGQVLAPTGNGGAFCIWGVQLSGSETDIYAQKIDRFGQIGTPEPRLVSVRDVPNDQGGHVRVSWDRSPLDRGLNPVVHGYQVWRQVPQSLAEAGLAAGTARILARNEDVSSNSARRLLRAFGTAAQVTYWEYAGGVAAQNFAGYSLVASTTSDSIAGSNPRTSFLVEAVDDWSAPGPVVPAMYWTSSADSGYSVDNLPPTIPSGFAGAWSNGAGASLHWNANAETDLATYRLYRGTTAGFVPSLANRIATPTQTWFEDAGSLPAYYRLTAVDIHGNESGSVLLQPAGTVDVAADLPRAIDLALTSANPASGAVSFRVDLPAGAKIEVAVYDASGRLVRELAKGSFEAGRWPLAWNGADANGARSRAGMYFVRMLAAGRTWSRRVVWLP